MQRYYVKRPTGKVFGPFDENAIRLMLESDKIGADAEVSTDKQSWQPISEVAVFDEKAGDAELPTVKADAGSQLPTSKSGNASGPQLPKSKSDGAGGPELPKPKAGGAGGPELPKPKADGAGGPELPKPKAGGAGGPELPTSKSDEGKADLPRSAQNNLPKSGDGPELPRSAGDNLPKSGDGPELPRSAGDNLPKSGDGPELPRNAEENLPQSGNDVPPAADPPDDDDLFGAPVEDDDDDLFDAPGMEEDSDDLFAAPGVEEDSDDLFAAPGMEEESDDLFDAPGMEEESDDLFAEPEPVDADDSDDLDDDDLFDSPEMDDDDLFADAPGGDEDEDDDFLGGDDSFAFLDDEEEDDDGGLEDWEQDISSDDEFAPDDLGAEEDDWGDDLLDDEPAADSPRTPEGDSTEPPVEVDDKFRPASTGIKDERKYGLGPDGEQQTAEESAQTSTDEAVDADRKRGLVSLVGVVLVGVLLFGGAGFGIYHGFIAGDDDEVDEGPRMVELSIDQLRSGNFGDLRELLDRATTGELDDENEARLLLAQSLYLTNYEDDEVAKQAASLADRLAGDDDRPTTAVALATYEAQNAEPDTARALAEPVADDPDLGMFAHLAMGIGDAMAHFEGDQFDATLQVTAEADDTEAFEETDGLAGEADEAASDDDQPDDTDEPAAEADEETEPQQDEESDDDGESEAADEEDGGEDRDEMLAARAADHFEAAADADSSSALPHYWLARLSVHVDDAEAALEHLERAVHADPSHVASRLQAGRLYHQRGSLTDAVEHLGEINDNLAADASDNERAESLHLTGLVHQARQESQQAIDYFTRALSADSSRVDTLRALAEEYERAQSYEEALNFFTTDEQLRQEDPEVVLGIVRSYTGLERWTAATDKLEESLEQFPDDARFPYRLGRLQEERRNFREARDAYERAIEIDNSHLQARAALARLIWQIDRDAAEGDRQVEAIIEHADQIDAALASQVAEFFHLSDRPDTARLWNEEALRLDPNFWDARLALARIYLDQQETLKALELLEHARDEGIQDLRLSAYLADAYRQNGQFDRAIDEINSVLQHEDADDAEYIFIRGRIYFDRGNYATAHEDFNNAYDLDPQFHEAYFYVGRAALAQGDQAQAIRVFRHVLDFQEDNGEAHYYLGRAYEEDRSINQALNSYSNAISADSEFVEENPEVLVRRGQIRARLGRSARAQRDIHRAIEKDPDNPEALLAVASLNFEDGNYEAAIDNYTRVLEDDSEQPDAHYELGMSYVHEDQEQEGVRHLQLALRHGYDDPEIYRRLGYLYIGLGQNADALDAFETFIRETDEDEIATSTRREVLRQIRQLGG